MTTPFICGTPTIHWRTEGIMQCLQPLRERVDSYRGIYTTALSRVWDSESDISQFHTLKSVHRLYIIASYVVGIIYDMILGVLFECIPK